MLAYFKVYQDLQYTGFPPSDYDELEKIYVYEPIPDINMTAQELCDQLNEKKERTNNKVVLDKYYYAILLVNFYMWPFQPGYIYGFISFANPIKNMTIRGIQTRSLRMFDNNIIRQEIDAGNKEFLVKLDDLVEYDDTRLHDLNYSKQYILSKQLVHINGGDIKHVAGNSLYYWDQYNDKLDTFKWNLLDVTDVTITNLLIEPVSIYRGHVGIPTTLIDQTTWESSDETTKTNLVINSVETPQDKVFLGIDPRKISGLNHWLRNFWVNKTYQSSNLYSEEHDTAEFQYLSGIDGVLLDHFIVTVDETTNNISFKSLLSSEDYQYIPIETLSNSKYSLDRTYSEKHATSGMVFTENALEVLPTYFHDATQWKEENDENYLWKSNSILENQFSINRVFEDSTDTADWKVNQNNAVWSLDVTTFNWLQRINSKFRPFWSESWAVGDISSAEPHFQVFYHFRQMDETSLDLLNSINWNPRDLNWWVEHFDVLPQVKFHHRWFVWEIDGTDLNIIDKKVHVLNDVQPVDIADATTLHIRDWNIVFNANDTTQTSLLVEKTWQWHHSWEFQSTDTTFIAIPTQSLSIHLHFHDDNTTHLFDATRLISDTTFSISIGDSSNLGSTFYGNLMIQRLYEQDSSIFFAWQFLSTEVLNINEPLFINEIDSNDHSTFIFPLSAPHIDMLQTNFPDTTMDHPTLGLIAYDLHGIKLKTDIEQYMLAINLLHPITEGHLSNVDGTMICHNKQPWIVYFSDLHLLRTSYRYNPRRYDMLYNRNLLSNKPSSWDITYVNQDMTDINDTTTKPVVDWTIDKQLINPLSDGVHDAIAIYESFPSDVTYYSRITSVDTQHDYQMDLAVLYSTSDSTVALSKTRYNSGYTSYYQKVTISDINDLDLKLRLVAPNMQSIRDKGYQEYYVDPSKTIGKRTLHEETQILCDDIHDLFNQIGSSWVFIKDDASFNLQIPQYRFGSKQSDISGVLENIDQTTHAIRTLSAESLVSKWFDWNSLDTSSLWKLERVETLFNNLSMVTYNGVNVNYPKQHLRQTNCLIDTYDNTTTLFQYPMNKNYIVRSNNPLNAYLEENTGKNLIESVQDKQKHSYWFPMEIATYNQNEQSLTTKTTNMLHSYIVQILLMYGKRILDKNQQYVDQTNYVVYSNGAIGQPVQNANVIFNAPIKYDFTLWYPRFLIEVEIPNSVNIYESRNIIHGTPLIDLTTVLEKMEYGNSFTASQFSGSLILNDSTTMIDSTYIKLKRPIDIIGLVSQSYQPVAASWENVSTWEEYCDRPYKFGWIMQINDISGTEFWDAASPKTETLPHERPDIDVLENSNTGWYSKWYATFRLNAKSSDGLFNIQDFTDLNTYTINVGDLDIDTETYMVGDIIEKIKTLNEDQCIVINKALPNYIFSTENTLYNRYYAVIDSLGVVYQTTTNTYDKCWQANTGSTEEFFGRIIQDNINRNDPDLGTKENQRMAWYYTVEDINKEEIQNFINLIKNQNPPPKQGNLYLILPYSERLKKKTIKSIIES